MFLLDTNVISEYRKGARANSGVVQFFAANPNNAMFLPAQVVGEIQAGIARLRKEKNPQSQDRADTYERWLDGLNNLVLVTRDKGIAFSRIADLTVCDPFV